MKTAEQKREWEQKMVSQMIALYCRKNTARLRPVRILCKTGGIRQAAQRALPVYGVIKTFCSSCKVHCYKPEMREKIREVMRFSGPRMMLYHPLTAMRHIWYTAVSGSATS